MKNTSCKRGNLLPVFITVCLAALLIPVVSHAQKEVKYVREGNKNYDNGKYKDAEINYRKALENKADYYKGQFNLGDALYKQKNYPEAANIFENLAKTEGLDKYVVAKSYHNLGNSLLQQKKYQESIDAYKKALKVNPKDMDTKYNLEYAKKMLQVQQQQQQQQKQNQDQKKDQKQDQKKDQKQDQKKEDNKDQKKEGQQQQQQQNQISKEDAERMLNELRNKEQKTLDKLKKQEDNGQNTKPVKDW
jgi:tetratricopeptide (TPR) repeat protein